ncbi:DUF1631 domain-containing protein [Thiohalobacter sp. IOR34]|uniref:DUF1631 domain-containing protein n=1 Tax=Thiohalobacter sp. IOR34 TaxID=3057176 RepID=UPI0025AF2B30|nr:DUF1631 domain-containing protein [Thiohalobacter sp. IOR34]WJW75250.1 DUF1631 domain-containing protein [Thiohalobacter sp. IOR34]
MNIIHMNEFEQRRRGPSSPAHTEILRECRELAARELAAALTRMMGKVDDALFELAEKAENNAIQSLYFDAMREVRIKRSAIEASFRTAFLAGFNAEIQRQPPAGPAVADGDGELELDLVEHDALEESLAVSNMVTKVGVACSQELGLLERRMGFLLGDPQLEQGGNPVGPAVICNAFLEACGDIESGLKVKLIILKLFDRYVVGEDILPLYQKLNRLLTGKNILPDIRLELKRRPKVPDGGPAASPTTAGQAGEAPEGEVGEQDLFAALQRLMLSRSPGGVPAGTGSGAAAFSGFSGGRSGFIGGLTLLQQGDGELAGSGLAGIDSSAVAAGTVNVIRDIKASALAAGASGVDAMIINVVEMLFDYILSDSNIPDPMKALIGRLQIPLLKAAMLDRDLFSRKSHPARLLLNGLAEAANGWTEQDSALYRKIEGIVQRILVEFEEDLELFAELHSELNEFIAEEQRKAAERQERSARLLAGKERLRLAKAQVRLEIERRTRGRALPRFIEQFLVSYWQNLLLVTLCQEGDESLAWKRALATMDNLLWSIAPKQVTEREALVKLLPSLLAALREGVQTISMRESDFQDFLARLADLHAEVVNRVTAQALEEPPADDPLQPVAAEEAAPVEEDAEVTAATLHRLIRENGLEDVEVEEITLSEEADAMEGAPDDEFVEMARNLAQGTWVEFTADDGQTSRARLTWVSPVTGSFLFTNRQGLKAAEMTLQGLAAEFRRGTARPIENAPLFERAVNSLLDGLR